jgi:predicted CoA-binding protein
MPVDTDPELRSILDSETIAVVGCSATPGKAAHEVPAYLREQGYTVLPVNPYADEIFGREPYDALGAVTETVDIVDVFRPSEEVAGIVDAALAREDCPVLWLQQGIRDDDAAARAEASGRRVVQDRCLQIEHQRLVA